MGSHSFNVSVYESPTANGQEGRERRSAFRTCDDHDEYQPASLVPITGIEGDAAALTVFDIWGPGPQNSNFSFLDPFQHSARNQSKRHGYVLVTS